MPTSLLLHCCSPTPTHSNLRWQVFLILHPLEFRWYISFKVPFFSHLFSRRPRLFSWKNEVPRLHVFTTCCMSFWTEKPASAHMTHHVLITLSSVHFLTLKFFSLSSCTQTQHTFAIHLSRGLLPLSKPNDVLMRRCVWHPPSLPSLLHSASVVRSLQSEGCSDASERLYYMHVCLK